MNPRKIIDNARSMQRRALSEFDSKQVLASYGVPITSEVLAQNADQAIAAAADMPGKVALKACSSELMHKSDGGWIVLGLSDAAEIATAHDRLVSQAAEQGAELEGILVQEMISGNRELVLGLSRDPQFGPCVMIGMGGVFAEVLKDTSFRMAPVDRLEAAEMIADLNCVKMLGAFRGQQPVDTDALCAAIQGLAQIGLDFPEVAEIDVNPLIIEPSGAIKAVDGLVVFGD